MASLSTDPQGNRTVQFIGKDGRRRSIRLGKMPKKAANEFKLKVEDLAAARTSNLPVGNETAVWLRDLGDDFLAKLANAGLVEPRATPAEPLAPTAGTLDSFLRDYIALRADAKPKTLDNLAWGRKQLVEFFGADKPVGEITPGDADRWVFALRSNFAPATVAHGVKKARQFFDYAVRSQLIGMNPFRHIKAGKMSNSSRQHFVSREATEKLLDACSHDATWQAIIALARYGGLRCPSEIYQLTWDDIDWDRNRFLVRSPKLEKDEHNGQRWVPLFPELRKYIDRLWAVAPERAVHVIERKDGQTRGVTMNLRTQLLRIIRRAGLLPWPKLFQNMRSSRETELVQSHPLHVVVSWIGNSEEIAKRHYLQVTDADFQKALQIPVHYDATASNNEQQPERAPKHETRENHGFLASICAESENLTEEMIPPRGVEPLF